MQAAKGHRALQTWGQYRDMPFFAYRTRTVLLTVLAAESSDQGAHLIFQSSADRSMAPFHGESHSPQSPLAWRAPWFKSVAIAKHRVDGHRSQTLYINSDPMRYAPCNGPCSDSRQVTVRAMRAVSFPYLPGSFLAGCIGQLLRFLTL